MRSEIEQLKAKINTFEQNKTGDKIIVRGVNGDENASDAIKKIAQLVGVGMVDSDIVFANQTAAENKTPTITAKLSSQHKKAEFIKAAKKKRLSTQIYGYGGDSKPIYVDEQLTKYTYTLLAQAKQLKKIGIKHVWVSNGDVLYRQTDDSKTQRILSSHQVKEIEKGIMLSKNKATNSKTRTQQNSAQHQHKHNNSKRKGKHNKSNERSDDGDDDVYESS